MLGKDIKKLIKLYRETIINENNIEQLALIDESVLQELIKGINEDDNLINEDLLKILYEVVFMDIQDSVKIKAIEVMKSIPLSIAIILKDHLESLCGMTFYDNKGLLSFIENIRVIKEEESEEFESKLSDFISAWETFSSNIEDGEYHYEDFSFARSDFAPLLDYLAIKSVVYEIEESDVVHSFETELETQLLYYSHHKKNEEDSLNEKEFYKLIRSYIEDLYNDIPKEYDRFIFNSISLFISGFQYNNLKTYLDFVSLFYFNEENDEYVKLLLYVEKELSSTKEITIYKLGLINEIMEKIDCEIDSFNDTRFIMKLLSLTMSDLEKISDFAKYMNQNNVFSSDDYPYLTDRAMIERFDELKELIRRNPNGSEELEDDTDYSLVTLRLKKKPFNKERKKKLFPFGK